MWEKHKEIEKIGLHAVATVTKGTNAGRQSEGPEKYKNICRTSPDSIRLFS